MGNLMAITVPVAGQEASAEQFGIPVANEVNRMTPLVVAPTPWTTLVLQNGWVNQAGTAQYRKVGDMVQMRGTVGGGTAGTNVAILPVGFRPPAGLFLNSTCTNGGPFLARVYVDPGGAFTIEWGTGGTNNYVSLAGSFSVTP